ncbi:MAG: protease inhibitor I42 family protein [Rudaea sp.]|uniref:protease inhibitor I42 family protein n=1 Tax=Rudaea sp. TaxID=2136325 RepID=UPI0039E3A8F1
MSLYTLIDSQDGTALDLRAGDVVVLRLAENPTTGYRWEVVEARGFEHEADDFTGAPASGTGRGGERALRFKATATGAARIDLVLRRNWESAAPQRRYSITATIR